MVDLKKSLMKINTKVLPELSDTENRVAEWLTRGLSEKEIAEKMFVSRDTIHTHTYNIRKKLNARCAVDVARKFILSLENPGRFFTVLAFLIIQGNIVFAHPDMDLRRSTRTSTRIVRTSRKNKE